MIRLLDSQHIIDCKSIERVVANFCQESDTEYGACENKQGLYQQTLETISNIVVHKPTGSFLWLDTDNVGNVLAYVLTHVSKDVDNKLCYYMTQAWLVPSLRHTHYAKEAIRCLRNHAKQLFCKHIIVVSSRNTKAYLRLLGGQFKPYVMLLKEDI